jgi:hypothetical protein
MDFRTALSSSSVYNRLLLLNDAMNDALPDIFGKKYEKGLDF